MAACRDVRFVHESRTDFAGDESANVIDGFLEFVEQATHSRVPAPIGRRCSHRTRHSKSSKATVFETICLLWTPYRLVMLGLALRLFYEVDAIVFAKELEENGKAPSRRGKGRLES